MSYPEYMECRDMLVNQTKGGLFTAAGVVDSDPEDAPAVKPESKATRKQAPDSKDKSELERLIPNSSSLTLLFSRASNMSLQVENFSDRWIYLLAGIAKMMQAQSCEMVVFEKDCKNLLLELEPG